MDPKLRVYSFFAVISFKLLSNSKEGLNIRSKFSLRDEFCSFDNVCWTAPEIEPLMSIRGIWGGHIISFENVIGL